MIPKGIGDIRAAHSINTRPGPMTEKDLLLRLYKLASLKANFQKKKEWAERQRVQAIRHLSDIQRQIGMLKKLAMTKIGTSAQTEKAGKQENPPRPERGKKWSEVSLKY